MRWTKQSSRSVLYCLGNLLSLHTSFRPACQPPCPCWWPASTCFDLLPWLPMFWGQWHMPTDHICRHPCVAETACQQIWSQWPSHRIACPLEPDQLPFGWLVLASTGVTEIQRARNTCWDEDILVRKSQMIPRILLTQRRWKDWGITLVSGVHVSLP